MNFAVKKSQTDKNHGRNLELPYVPSMMAGCSWKNTDIVRSMHHVYIYKTIKIFSWQLIESRKKNRKRKEVI
jgi:hypothetical protein